MKKIAIFSTIMLIAMILLMSNVYAESTCDVNINSNKWEIIKNEEITLTFSLSNIKDEMGILIIGATLKYDKNILELKNMEAIGGWSGPSYNESNGIFVLDRNDYTKKNGAMIKVTFKAIEESENNTIVGLTNIAASNGLEDIDVKETAISLKIKPVIVDSGDNNTDQGNNTQNPNPVEPPKEEQKPETKPNEKPETKPNGDNNSNKQPDESISNPTQIIGGTTNKPNTAVTKNPNKVDSTEKNDIPEAVGTVDTNIKEENILNDSEKIENNDEVFTPISEKNKMLTDSNRVIIIIGAITTVAILAEILFFMRKINMKKNQKRRNSVIEDYDNYDDVVNNSNETVVDSSYIANEQDEKLQPQSNYNRNIGYRGATQTAFNIEMQNNNVLQNNYARIRYMPEIKNRNNYSTKMMGKNHNRMI